MNSLNRENVSAFLRRDWARSRRSKDVAVGRFAREHGTDAAFALAQSLLEAVWPRINSRQARAEDLKSHLVLREKLKRAASVRR